MRKNSTDKRKEQLMKLLEDKRYSPMRAKEIAAVMNVPAADRRVLNGVIKELEAEGKLNVSKRGHITLPQGTDMISGQFLKGRGANGFVRTEDGVEDILIPPRAQAGARHRDTVLCRLDIVSGGARRSGSIARVVSRGIVNITGVFEAGKTGGEVLPDMRQLAESIHVPRGRTMNAVSGSKVCVHITADGDGVHPEGIITEVLGHKDDPGVDVMAILVREEVPVEFPEGAAMEAEAAPDRVLPKEFKGRADYRKLLTITVDGADSKDLDDAISLTVLDNGHFRLGVYIADVAHYVRRGSALMEEAEHRGTSIYLADRVVPMLPRKLSNGICSLNAHEDRLALCCTMEIDKNGKVLRNKLREGVINVDYRMTYEGVSALLAGNDDDSGGEYTELLPTLRDMLRLSDILREKRLKRGCVEFDFPECKLIMGEDGKPSDIKVRRRDAATGIIEEFMILCNETVAEEYALLELPFVYRTHEEPDGEKLRLLAETLNGLGIRFRPGKNPSAAIKRLLERVEGTTEDALVNRLVLRSMKRAAYTPQSIGHFGLASRYYCHFTSPIRRLPDLFIHGVIKEQLSSGMDAGKAANYEKRLPELCRSASELERRAESLEREVERIKKAQYMERYIGEAFDGVISGVTSHGIYVELGNTVEGMISLSELNDDYYVYDEKTQRLQGERKGRVYRLGDRTRVRLARADGETGLIDFVFVV